MPLESVIKYDFTYFSRWNRQHPLCDASQLILDGSTLESFIDFLWLRYNLSALLIVYKPLCHLTNILINFFSYLINTFHIELFGENI